MRTSFNLHNGMTVSGIEKYATPKMRAVLTEVPTNFPTQLHFTSLRCLGTFYLEGLPKHIELPTKEHLCLCASSHGVSVHAVSTGIPFTRGCFTLLMECFDVLHLLTILNASSPELYIQRCNCFCAQGFDRKRIEGLQLLASVLR